MINIKDLREQMPDVAVKEVLAQYNVEPYYETEDYIIFPTCCHNYPVEGASNKLFYYKNSKLFTCFTECHASFDIFELIMKMEKLRGHEISLIQAVNICNLDIQEEIQVPFEQMQDLKYLQEMNNKVAQLEVAPIQQYDPSILTRYIFSLQGVEPWLEENITLEQLQHFQIKFDPLNNAIVIPNFDYYGHLIGVRGRFLNPEAPAKYMPLSYNGITLSHPTGKTLYGIWENHKNIEKYHRCIIFEGEKSVLKYGSIYADNIALATLGKNITKDQINLLLHMHVSQVILAYDADYETADELTEKRKEYTKIAKILARYFNVSILLDYELELDYKDSPIDKGRAVFERILKERVQI